MAVKTNAIITVNNRKSIVNKDLWCYEDDKNIDIYFMIEDERYEVISEEQSLKYYSFTIIKPNGLQIDRNELIPIETNHIKLKIDGISDFDKVGKYIIQIHLYDTDDINTRSEFKIPEINFEIVSRAKGKDAVLLNENSINLLTENENPINYNGNLGIKISEMPELNNYTGNGYTPLNYEGTTYRVNIDKIVNKTVNEKTASLNDMISNDIIKSENLFNKNSSQNILGKYINSNYQLIESSSYYISHPIYVKQNEKYTIRYAETVTVIFYNKDNIPIGYTGGKLISPFTFATTNNTHYIRFNGKKIDEDMCVLGLKYPMSYIEYYKTLHDDFKLNNKNKNEIIKITEQTINDNLVKKYISENLLNLDTIENGYYLVAGNNRLEHIDYCTINYISCNEGDVVKYTYDEKMYGNNVLHLYNNSKQYIKSLTINECNLFDTYRVYKVDIKECKYFKVSYSKKIINSAMVVINNDYPTNYIKYVNKKFLNNDISLNDTQRKEISECYSLNKLYGKIITFNGDSICAGAGFLGGYGKIIANRNNMIYENIAVGGGTITSGTYSGEVPKHWICKTIDKMRNDADYIILEGGVNDISLSVKLGSITNGYNEILDDTTFCGAFESMLKQSILKYQGKKIGFIITHRLWKTGDTGIDFETNWYPRILQMCAKWGIPVCDLYKNTQPLNLIPELKTKYTKDGDGWHPNEEGYKLFYCDKIESWIRNL